MSHDGLQVRGIVKRYGGVTAVDGVDIDVAPGEIVGFIGPNGAGKTTLFDCISGFTTPDEGHVRLDGAEIGHLPVEERSRAGLGRTFQRLAVFPTMTVRDHLAVAVDHAGHARGVTADGLDRMLGRFQLDTHAGTRAGDLPTGILRRVEIARAICTGARVMLLDEPASGLDSGEVLELAVILADVIANRDTAVLLVEHNVDFVLDLSHRVVVMAAGRIIADGKPTAVVEDPDVQAAYLGSSAEAGR